MKICPKCNSERIIKSGIVRNRQRYKCKVCNYFFTRPETDRRTSNYIVIKAMQLYLEGISLREIERLLGVSHTTVSNWAKEMGIKKKMQLNYYPSYKILKQEELQELISQPDFLKESGMIISELGDKYMVIKWERFKHL